MIIQAMDSKVRRSLRKTLWECIGSNGSVIPLLEADEAESRYCYPSEITRYFMTIPEAARLVIQAGAMAKGGEIFILDMGESVKIADLAET